MDEGRRNRYGALVMVCAAAVFSVALAGMLAKREPFYSWFYTFAWWTYIFFVEAFLYRRGGDSLLFGNPGRFLVLVPLSITTWLVFEAFNFRLENWHYINVPVSMKVRWAGYAVSFATVLPGLFATMRLLDHFRLFHARGSVPPLLRPSRLYLPFFAAGALLLVLPVLWPRFFFPLVWLGFIFLLEPVNHRLGALSILRDWEGGSLRRLYLLLAAGAVCGLLWETWNYWAGTKWVYSVPFVGWLKVFEMPLLGFFGFPPFAVECYVMSGAFFAVKDRWSRKLPVERRAIAWIILGAAVILVDALIFLGIDALTVMSFAQEGSR